MIRYKNGDIFDNIMKKFLSLILLSSAIAGFCAEELLIVRPRIYYSGESEEIEALKYSRPVAKEESTRNPGGTESPSRKAEPLSRHEKIKLTLYRVKFVICYQMHDPDNLYNIWNGMIYSGVFTYRDNAGPEK